MQLPEMYETLQRFDACRTEAQITSLTIDCISEYGAEYYFAVEMPPEDLPKNKNREFVIGGHWNDRWTERYFTQDYLRRDPTIAHVRTKDAILFWDKIDHKNLDGQKIMSEAEDFGLRSGITIPQKDLFGKRIGISFAGDKLDLDNSFLSTGLSVIAAYAVSTHLRISQNLEALKKVKLTHRENEVLKWLADGATSTDTAEKLGISMPTVEKHFRTALTKLGALNRTHAIAIAMRLGLIK